MRIEERKTILLEELAHMSFMEGNCYWGMMLLCKKLHLTEKAFTGKLRNWGETDWLTRIANDRRDLTEWTKQNRFMNQRRLIP